MKAAGQALRSHLRNHNRSVLAASGISLVVAAFAWAVLYGLAYWITIFGTTIIRGIDARPPSSFHVVFLACAGALVVAAMMHAWFSPEERAADSRPPLEHVADILLFVPRITLAFWGNLSALVSLDATEQSHAAELLDRLKIEGKVSLQQLPAQIPDAKSRSRIIQSLSVTQLIDVRKAGDLTWLHLSSLAPAAFHDGALEDESPADHVAGMRSANPPQRRNLLTGPSPEDDEN